MRRRIVEAAVVAAALAAAIPVCPAFGQPPAGRFYNVDKEVRIEAVVREVRLEPRYKGAAPFLILRVEEAGRAKAYDVEIAPSWFFGQDVHAGEKVRIVGSLDETGPKPVIIARELQIRGETFALRDKRGFPNWQGGPRRRGIRRLGGW